MNHLRSHKFKLSTADSNNAIASNNNNNNNNNSNGSGKGLFTRIKRYSTLGSKFSRRHHKSSGNSPPKIASGCYNMTGENSEDHRLEIGAPILISTTTLDADRFGVTEARLKQIGGGVAFNSTFVTRLNTSGTAPCTAAMDSTLSSPQIHSSSSENEDFVDAISTPPATHPTVQITTAVKDATEEDDLFASPCETPAPHIEAMPHTTASAKDIVAAMLQAKQPAKRNPLIAKQARQHSKSVQNLHRAELKMSLQKSPSMVLNRTAPEFNVPALPELYGASVCSLAASDLVEAAVREANKENTLQIPLSPTATSSSTTQSQSEPNTPVINAEQKLCGFLAQQHHFKSIDSIQLSMDQQQLPQLPQPQQPSNKRYSTLFANNLSHEVGRNGCRQQHGSNYSLTSNSSQLSANHSCCSNGAAAIEDFDLRSVSYQSLIAQQLFVSIDELNEITRQINESEEFTGEIDLEYCTHRDNLKPSERRITLLTNKNTHLIRFNNNKAKLKKSWNGMKHWIGEESTRLKEVVQKQTPLKHLDASRLNLSQSNSTLSPVKRNKRDQSQETDAETSTATATERSTTLANELSTSCGSITVDEHEEIGTSFAEEQDQAQAVQDISDEDAKRFKDEGQNGFEELRRYVKQGGDFSKELIVVLQERVDAELTYSKSLSKMATKLNKVCRELPGSIADAWRGVATEMESRSDIHRQLAASLIDEIVKPLKTIVESNHKARKTVESNVDKAVRLLNEWRASEAKAKKTSHTAARENEKLQDAMLDVRIQKSPSIALLHQGPNKVAAEKEIKSAEKDCVKLDNKRKKAEEAVKRADVDYYTLCVRAERARVDWEMAMLRGSTQLQSSENQRLINMKNFVTQYARLTADMNPILASIMQSLQPQIDACNVAKDMQIVRNIRRNSEGPSEQLLPDFYCEHTTLAMNRERRKHALIKLLNLVKTDLERERRSRDGLRGLSQSLNNQEHQNITDKLYHIRSMLTYLEGARLKLHSALLELDHKPRATHPLAQHIQITRDRTGLQQSILKVPNWLKNNDKLNTTHGTVESLESADVSAIQIPTTASELNGNQSTVLPFNRSKSNIETKFSSNPKIIGSAGVAVTAAPGVNVVANKSKTIPANGELCSDRGQADGGSNQQDSDFDEFSSQDDDDEDEAGEQGGGARRATRVHKVKEQQQQQQQQQQNHYQNTQEALNSTLNTSSTSGGASYSNNSKFGGSSGSSASSHNHATLGRCKALYSYKPKLYDELELSPGDIIEVHAKQDDGWWLGALRNQIGIFPATYVEECV